MPIFCFLISNGDRHLLFDLGVRADWENYSPTYVKSIKKVCEIRGRKNIAGILDEQDESPDHDTKPIRSKDIEAVIWSHYHFDHIGDPSTFPNSTAVVMGPDAKDKCFPGYPTNPDAGLLDSDIEGREVIEIDFTRISAQVCRIGRFDAFDYFGDGSFYLLDAPGHAVGHMCGLARVTTSSGPASGEDTFIFMGADACHHPGVLRPTDYLPIPKEVSPSPFNHLPVCPGDLLLSVQPGMTPTRPFFTVCPDSFPDLEAAMTTVEKIQEFDADDNVLIIVAHDDSIAASVDFFPKIFNDWKAKGLRSETRWLFCKDFEQALK